MTVLEVVLEQEAFFGEFFWGAAPNPARGMMPLDPLLSGEGSGGESEGCAGDWCSCEQAIACPQTAH